MAVSIWSLHGDGKHVTPGEVVKPEERLSWGRTTGIGVQHVLAMFGATVLMPVLMKFPVTTTVFFSGIGTLLFLLVVRNRIPSYLGASASFIAPVLAAQAQGGIAVASGGILVAGLAFALVGLLVHWKGLGLVNAVMPPIVTGSVVAVIGLALAPIAKNNFEADPTLALVTLAATVLAAVGLRGFIGRLSIFVGVVVGYILAAILGRIDYTALGDAAWFGAPPFHLPEFQLRAILLILPVVVVLIAENTGHVKAVATMTERDLDPYLGRAYVGDGMATAVAGAFGGTGTTTYAENIGVMAATRVYSTAAYVVAGIAAILLGLVPKFGALIATIPVGVLGGVTTVLYGLIAILGARIWVEARVDFHDPVNLLTAAVALIVGAADYTITIGSTSFGGIALGSFGAIILYQVLRFIARRRGLVPAEFIEKAPAADEEAARLRAAQEREEQVGREERGGAPPRLPNP